jgi:hypothetical protein
MTLRELIQEIIRLDELESVATKITEIHPEWSGKKQSEVLKTYTRVAHEIEDLPGDEELEGHVIVIDDIQNTLFNKTESWVDVHLQDDDKDKWSIDMTDWNGLVDLKIIDNKCKTLSERLAYILFEITFWGTTRQAVINESRQLEKIARDKDNLIEVTMEEFLAEIDQLN